ncbi:hypothetical protein M0812_15954 [Anaeramoeba flamelloides]|uniref:Uncharacterized protein n=1 Tax=Anaeramoeba flamelloides TaxID=1746091 RepID=A0AAV7ZJC4_9EUKA|nr:hypothetical protein M0812_15954 [Anaeramoeba flamelloides]
MSTSKIIKAIKEIDTQELLTFLSQQCFSVQLHTLLFFLNCFGMLLCHWFDTSLILIMSLVAMFYFRFDGEDSPEFERLVRLHPNIKLVTVSLWAISFIFFHSTPLFWKSLTQIVSHSINMYEIGWKIWWILQGEIKALLKLNKKSD